MKMSIKKRIVIGASVASTLGAVATLVAGVTFGFFSATTPSQDNTFSAGTVTLDAASATSCTVQTIQPGDSGTCTFQVTYTGTVSGGAYLGVDVGVTNPVPGNPAAPYQTATSTTLPSAALGLYDSSANGLQVTITDDQSSPVTYMSGTSWNQSPTTGTTPSVADLLVNPTPITSDTTITFTLAWSLPLSANNAYDDAASTITLLVHAVQAANNGTPASISACVAGDVCPAISSWS